MIRWTAFLVILVCIGCGGEEPSTAPEQATPSTTDGPSPAEGAAARGEESPDDAPPTGASSSEAVDEAAGSEAAGDEAAGVEGTDEAASHTASVDLLHAVPASVATSSAYRGQLAQVAKLVDGDSSSAWNSETADLAGAWVEARIPANATLTSIALTSGFTRVRGGTDLFAGNHRVVRVRVLRDGVEVGVHALDPESRELQTLPVSGPGGIYRLEILEVVAGSRDDWRETCISELRLMGTAPGAEADTHTPAVSIGALARVPAEPTVAVDEAPAATGTEATLRSQLMTFLEDYDVRRVELTSLSDDTQGVAFDVNAEVESTMAEESMRLLAIGIPVAGEQVYFAFQLGESSMEPGAESTTVISGFSGLSVDHGVVHATFDVTSAGAEFDTCADCQGRREEATLRRHYALVCAALEDETSCTVTEIGLTVVRPADDVDEQGRRTPAVGDDPPNAYAVALAITDSENVSLTRTSGEVPNDLRAQLGDLYIADLEAIGRSGDRLDEF